MSRNHGNIEVVILGTKTFKTGRAVVHDIVRNPDPLVNFYLFVPPTLFFEKAGGEREPAYTRGDGWDHPIQTPGREYGLKNKTVTFYRDNLDPQTQ